MAIKCTFCDDPAIGKFYLDQGCIASDQKEQLLCLHHYHKSNPTNDMILIESFIIGENNVLPID